MRKNLEKVIIYILLFSVIAIHVSSTTLGVSKTTDLNPDFLIDDGYNVVDQNSLWQYDDVRDLPYPGHMSTPYLDIDIPDIPDRVSRHHTITSPFIDENVVALIEQLDEMVVLDYLENLTAFGPRVTGTAECYAAGDYIYNEFQDMGLDVRFHNWTKSGYEDRNVEATLPGVDNTSDEIYIICAHFDTVPGSPGADDDGSGVAAVMSAAYIMSQYEFNHTIRFVAFSGEEEGLHGSYRYAEDADGNNDNIVGVLNIDMIGFALTASQGNKIKVFYNDESEWLTDFTVDVSQQYDEYLNLEVIYSGYSSGSDHYSFWVFNYHSIFYHEYEFNHYYHSPDDTIEHMNLTYAAKCSRLILATLAELAQPVGTFNKPPNRPSIDGPVQGIAGEEYNYTFVTSDPEGYDVYYYVDWGDGYVEEWIGPFSSNEEITIGHTWDKQGIYLVKAKAMDVNETKSSWSDPLSIAIDALEIIDIKGGLGVKAELRNIAKIDITNMNWSISVNGGFLGLVNKTTSDTILHLTAGDTKVIQTEIIFGLGPIAIKVNVDPQTREATGFIIGPFVLIL